MANISPFCMVLINFKIYFFNAVIHFITGVGLIGVHKKSKILMTSKNQISSF